MRVHHIVICGLSGAKTFFFLHYLINKMIFEKKKLLNTNYVFRFSLQILSEIVLTLRRNMLRPAVS